MVIIGPPGTESGTMHGGQRVRKLRDWDGINRHPTKRRDKGLLLPGLVRGAGGRRLNTTPCRGDTQARCRDRRGPLTVCRKNGSGIRSRDARSDSIERIYTLRSFSTRFNSGLGGSAHGSASCAFLEVQLWAVTSHCRMNYSARHSFQVWATSAPSRHGARNTCQCGKHCTRPGFCVDTLGADCQYRESEHLYGPLGIFGG